MKTDRISCILLFVVLLCAITLLSGFVRQKGEKIFIVDQTGRQWDVTRAKANGFDPKGFQYGIGKDAFVTLDDRHLTPGETAGGSNPRIIGIRQGDEAHAYSVDKLWRHEIANTLINGLPVAAGY